VGKKYKLKTYKAASKRFRVTGSGKVVRTKGGKSHLRRRTAKRNRRLLDKTLEVAPADRKRIKRLMPYMKKYKANPPG
jgi:large subunit ribosomal protein L35